MTSGTNLWVKSVTDRFNLSRTIGLHSNNICNKNRTVCNLRFQNQSNIEINRVEFRNIFWYRRVFIFFLWFQSSRILWNRSNHWRPENKTETFVTMIIDSKTSTNIDYRIRNIDKRPNQFQNKFQSRNTITNRFQLWNRAAKMAVDAMKTFSISMKDDIGDRSIECHQNWKCWNNFDGNPSWDR